MKKVFAGILMSVATFGYAQDVPVLRLTLEQVVQQTLKTSPRFLAAQFDYEAGLKRSRSQLATLFPRLSFDASYRYQR